MILQPRMYGKLLIDSKSIIFSLHDHVIFFKSQGIYTPTSAFVNDRL